MSRFEKYKESVNKFINNKSRFGNKGEWKSYVKYITDVNNYLSVSLLTFANNLNHKHNKKILGYNCACALNCMEASETHKLSLLNLIAIYVVMDYQNGKQLEKLIITHLIDLKTPSNEYANKQITLSKLMVKLCYQLYNISVPNNVLNVAREFGIMLKINEEFVAKSCKNDTSVYFEKAGIQKMHEMFMQSKSTCIKYALKLDLLTSTFQEILDHIQSNIENIMERLSTDS
jgi:hypothetical protein